MERRTVKEASVEGVQRRMQPKKHFVFCIKVTWSDGTVNLVYRRYSQFLHVQSVLLQAFPKLKGSSKKKRSFSQLPDSVAARVNIGDNVFRRMEQVNYFLKEILALESKHSQSVHVITFLRPTPEDLEPKHRVPVRGSRKTRDISKKMKGRLQKFGRTVKPWANKISSPIVMEHFLVMEDYAKQAKVDISLKKGRFVDVIEKRECGWWLVDADGEVGWAPALYLAPADDFAESAHVQTFQIGRGEVYETTKRYVAAEDDELTFEIGINLQILEKNYDGWWKALYLGQEGWVPSMYLRKLGNDRRKTGRRRSRMFSNTQLRDTMDDINEEETIQEETPAEVASEVAAGKSENKRVSLPRKISKHLLGMTGDQTSTEISGQNSKDDKDGDENTDSAPKEEKKTITSMIAMSSAFMEMSKNNETRDVTPKASPRPHLKRRAISTVVSSTFDLGSLGRSAQETKDDMSLQEKSKSLSALHTGSSTQQKAKSADDTVISKWRPEIKDKFSSGGDRSRKISAPAYLGMGKQTNGVNDLSFPGRNSSSDSVKVFESLENIQESEENESDSCDIMQDSTSSTELEECATSYNGVHVDSSMLIKSISMDRDSPRFDAPKRSLPEPVGIRTWPRRVTAESNVSEPPEEEVSVQNEKPREDFTNYRESPVEGRESPRYQIPSRNPPVHTPQSTWPRSAMELEYCDNTNQENHSNANSLRSNRSVIRQEPFERETSDELNDEINCWSSSDESEPELGNICFTQVLVQHQANGSPAILVEGLEQCPMEEDGIEGEEKDEDDTDYHFDSVSSTMSLGLYYTEATKPKDDENFSDIYCTVDACEVDGEMTLSKGEYVRVIEKAITGWWLVQNEEGLKGWAPSNFLYPAPNVSEGVGCRLPESEEVMEKECSLEKSCCAIEEYIGDVDNQEVCLRKGEIAHVIHKSDSGWWCVRNEDGEVGWAPSTYLDELDNNNDIVFM